VEGGSLTLIFWFLVRNRRVVFLLDDFQKRLGLSTRYQSVKSRRVFTIENFIVRFD